MHIQITRRFDGTNTYFRARVFDTKTPTGRILIDYAYGYGDHGVHEALKELGFRRENGTADLHGYVAKGHTYSVADVARKKDL